MARGMDAEIDSAPIAEPASGVGRAIVVRRPPGGLDEGVPIEWLRGHPGVTQFVNALGALFPEGERFFVRSVRRFEDRIEDPGLRRDVRAFMAQEARHGAAHDAFLDVLAAQGLGLGGFRRVYARVCRLPPRGPGHQVALAITAAVEHFTAVMARITLRDRTLAGAHPAMRALYEWHAVEELEHKSVAFDVLRTVNRSYLLRLFGFLLCALNAGLFVGVPFVLLLAKTGLLVSPRAWWDLVSYGLLREGVFVRFWAGAIDYLRPSFHPDDEDDTKLLANGAGVPAT